jgi:hypothetical protein
MHKKQVSFHGVRDYLSTENRHVTQDAFVSGGEASVGRQGGSITIPGSPATVARFDDFLASDTGGQFNGRSRVNGDTDTGATGTVSRQSMVNGVMRVSYAGTALGTPAAAIGLTGGLIKNWKPDQGRLTFAARVKLPSLASVNAYIGFSDSGGSEMPSYDTGDAGGIPITNMADGIGFMYSNLGGVTTWRAVSARSVAGDSGDQTVNTGITPVANTYDVLEFHMGDSGEHATFFVNGVAVGRLTNPVEAKNALVPGVWVFGSDTGTIQVDIDYIALSANRDSGT